MAEFSAGATEAEVKVGAERMEVPSRGQASRMRAAGPSLFTYSPLEQEVNAPPEPSAVRSGPRGSGNTHSTQHDLL